MPTKVIRLPEFSDVPGFRIVGSFVSPAEEAELLSHIHVLRWESIRMHGLEARRKVVHYGYTYSYDSRSIEKTGSFPAFLNELQLRAAKAAKVDPTEFAEVLITNYPEGAGIGWHYDAPGFGNTIFGLSLMGACTMKFRKKIPDSFEVRRFELAPRDAYIISGEARWKWQHSIPPVKEERYSITFRVLRTPGPVF